MSWTTPAGFSWSASRGGVFRDCPRAYYFQYYLANRRAIDSTPDEVAEAARLKQLTTIPLWIGSSVHDTIHNLLQVAAGGGVPDVERGVQTMVEEMRKDFWESVHQQPAPGRETRQYVRFHEHEYGRQVPDEEWSSRVEEAKTMVRACADRGYLERIRDLGAPAIRAMEDLQDWPLDGVRIFVKIDLAYQDGLGVINILDWKTGMKERGENPLQMMNYALFAMRRWNAPKERLTVMEVYLRQANPERPCRITDDSLAAAERDIRTSIAAMLARLPDPTQDVAVRKLLPAAPSPWKCRWCNFLALCPEGREAV